VVCSKCRVGIGREGNGMLGIYCAISTGAALVAYDGGGLAVWPRRAGGRRRRRRAGVAERRELRLRGRGSLRLSRQGLFLTQHLLCSSFMRE
jgi:hypothetical protein